MPRRSRRSDEAITISPAAKPAPIARRSISPSSSASPTAAGVRAAGWRKTDRSTSATSSSETPSRRYAQRTEWNIRDSDATVVFSIVREVTGGTALTLAPGRAARQTVPAPVARRSCRRPALIRPRAVSNFLAEHRVCTAQRRRPAGVAGTGCGRAFVCAACWIARRSTAE